MEWYFGAERLMFLSEQIFLLPMAHYWSLVWPVAFLLLDIRGVGHRQWFFYGFESRCLLPVFEFKQARLLVRCHEERALLLGDSRLLDHAFVYRLLSFQLAGGCNSAGISLARVDVGAFGLAVQHELLQTLRRVLTRLLLLQLLCGCLVYLGILSAE